MINLKHNYQLLLKAIKNNDVKMVNCTDRKTGKEIKLVCIVSASPEGPSYIPIAQMLEDNPYENFVYKNDII